MKSYRVFGLFLALVGLSIVPPAMSQEANRDEIVITVESLDDAFPPPDEVSNLEAKLAAAKAEVARLQKVMDGKPGQFPKEHCVAGSEFLRINRVLDEPQSLDTAIARYKNDKGVIVDLIGAVHVGEKEYYENLNKQFKQYDVLLYELVADKGARPQRRGPSAEIKIDPENPLSGVGSMQGMMTQVLGLQHQMEGVDYSPANFVHADLSQTDLQQRMAERGESPMVLMLEQLANMMKQANLQSQKQSQNASAQGPGGVSDGELIMAGLESFLTGEPSPVVKRYMALQMEDMETQTKMFSGGIGRLILDDRNAACFEVLDEQLATDVKSIGIFYGAAHLPDMQKRLEERGFKKQGTSWLQAWNLR